MKILILALSVILMMWPVPALANQDLLVTKSLVLKDEIHFDGIWTHPTEWKSSSLQRIETDLGEIYLRYAHQENFVYFLVDAVFDDSLDVRSDRATICFDTKNDKTKFAQKDDYCFVAVLGKRTGYTLHGGSKISVTSNFERIPNPDGFIAIGATSNDQDRYSKVPHSSYEFRIPTEVIGRSSVYGLYFELYDQATTLTYTWPQLDKDVSPYRIPSPVYWGELVSPDKSLPELNGVVVLVLSSFILVILSQNKRWTLLRN